MKIQKSLRKLNATQRLELADDLRKVEALYCRDPGNRCFSAGICYAVFMLDDAHDSTAYYRVNEALKLIEAGWVLGVSERLTHEGGNQWVDGSRAIMCLLMAHRLEDSVRS